MAGLSSCWGRARGAGIPWCGCVAPSRNYSTGAESAKGLRSKLSWKWVWLESGGGTQCPATGRAGGSRALRGRAEAKGWEGGTRASRERRQAGEGEEKWEGKEGKEAHRKAECEGGREERRVGGLGGTETHRDTESFVTT